MIPLGSIKIKRLLFEKAPGKDKGENALLPHHRLVELKGENGEMKMLQHAS